MKILITGTNGVIGKEIVNQLSKNRKYKLYLLSNKKNKSKKRFKSFYQNLTKPINLKLKPHAIIHCASKHPNSKSGNSMQNIYSTNMKMTKNLIKFANKNNVEKVFFFSSITVYGQIKNKIVLENQKPYKPNLYEKSKFLSEKLFCKKNNKFQAICLRIPGIFALDINKDYPLIIKVLKRLAVSKDVYSYNLNKKFNNILDVTEIVKFIKIVLRKKEKQSDVYNFSASKPIKFIRVTKLMKKIFYSKSKIINKDSNNTSFTISNKKIFNDFNFKTSTTEKIITRCCKSILKKI